MFVIRERLYAHPVFLQRFVFRNARQPQVTRFSRWVSFTRICHCGRSPLCRFTWYWISFPHFVSLWLLNCMYVTSQCRSYVYLRNSKLTAWSRVLPEKLNRSSVKKFPALFWNLKVHRRCHKKPPCVPLLTRPIKSMSHIPLLQDPF